MLRATRRGAVVGCALLAGCQLFDLALPESPEDRAGSVSGRVVVAEPGTGRRLPAVDAVVALQRSNLSVRTDADGRFVLSPLPPGRGVLALRMDTDGDGRADRQRDLDLTQIPGGIDLALGEVTLSENALVRGRALVDGATSHAGITVFIPGTPFAATTSDTGHYLLRDLPEGTHVVSAYKAGFRATSIANVTLGAGQVLDLRELVLAAESSTLPGALAGFVKQPDGAAASGVRVQVGPPGVLASEPARIVASTTTDADGKYAFTDLPAGLYDVLVDREGESARLPGVLVGAGSNHEEAAVFLAPGLAPDPVNAPDAGDLLPNRAPVALAADGVIAAGELATLDGTGSVDPDGDLLVYSWRQRDGESVLLDANDSKLASKSRFTAPADPQVLTFTLVVTDPYGATAEDEARLLVDQRPHAETTPELVASPGTTVTLDAASSADPDDSGALSYRWSIDADSTPVTLSGADSVQATFTAPANGSLVKLTLIVNDGYLDSLPKSVRVFVSDQPQPPVARVRGETFADWGEQLVLDPSASSDPNGNTGLRYAWRVTPSGCGTLGGVDANGVASAANGFASWTAPQGDCDGTITLKVTDTTNLTSEASFRVTVRDTLSPEVIDTVPSDGATATAPFGPVSVRFRRPVDAASAIAGFSLVRGTTPITGTTTYDSTTATLQFTPDGPMPAAALTATVNATSPAGETMSPHTFTFTPGRPTLQPPSTVASGQFEAGTCEALNGERWLMSRSTTYPYHARLFRQFRDAWAAPIQASVGFYLADANRLQPWLRGSEGSLWVGYHEAGSSAPGEIGHSRYTPSLTAATATKVDSNSPAAGAAAWGAAAFDDQLHPNAAWIDFNSTSYQLKLYRQPLWRSLPPETTPSTSWVAATARPSTTVPLTGLAMDGGPERLAVAWAEEPVGGTAFIHVEFYDWTANAWSLLPGATAGRLAETNGAILPTVRWWNGELVVAYYRIVASQPEIRVVAINPDTGVTRTIGSGLHTRTPQTDRLVLEPAGDVLWLGFTGPNGSTTRRPHVQLYDRRTGTWTLPTGTGVDGEIPLNTGCYASRPGICGAPDGGAMLVVNETCPTGTSQLLTRDVK